MPIIYVLTGLLLGYVFFRNNGDGKETQSTTTGQSTEQIWTCSMHPQIRQPEPGLCPICEMDLIPASESSGSDSMVFEMTDEAVKLAQVQTVTIGGSSAAAQKLELNGVIREDERRIYHQVSHFPGRIERLELQFTGEAVKRGQRIATIYSPELVQAQRELLEALKLQVDYPELAEAARTKLRNWKVSEEDIAAIETSGKVRENFPVYAEHSGVVNKRYGTLGDYISAGARLYEIVGLESVWVLFDAYEQDLPLIRPGDRIEFETPAVPGKRFSGRVGFIDPQLDGKDRVARVRVEQANPSGILKPGMYVQGTLTSNRGNNAENLTVPRSAVLWTGKRSVVWVQQEGSGTPVFEYREVVLGPAAGDHFQLISGVEAGEKVVSRGAFTLDAAAQLNNQSSMINGLMVGGVEDDQDEVTFSDIPSSFQNELQQVIEGYIRLKDALVNSEADASRKAASDLKEKIDLLNIRDLSKDARDYALPLRNEASGTAQKIMDGPDLDAMRIAFGDLSDALITLSKSMGVSGGKWYVQHCPMAFDNQGGDWISKESAIRNPYFGDRMLKCGMLTGQLGSD